MKELKIYLCLFTLLLTGACSEDKEIGNIPLLTEDYVLPQGKSSADNRIVELYNKYGTYFLYEFTSRDFEWIQVGIDDPYKYYTSADPLYVGDMLDLLQDIWFKFFPDEFLKKTLPYKVFLVDTLGREVRGTLKMCFFRMGDNKIAIGHCSDTLTKLSGSTKMAFKNDLHEALWGDWVDQGIIQMPDEFYDVSNYVDPIMPQSPEEERERGFIPMLSGGMEIDWVLFSWNYSPEEFKKASDIRAYLYKMLFWSYDKWEADFAYPLVKKKYDILRNYFNETYGIDVRQIGDATY